LYYYIKYLLCTLSDIIHTHIMLQL